MTTYYDYFTHYGCACYGCACYGSTYYGSTTYLLSEAELVRPPRPQPRGRE